MRLLTFTLVGLLSLLSLTACNATEPDYSQWLEEGVLIDTRTLEEFNAGHMTGAELIPYDQIAQKIGRVVESKETPILLYCRSGRRAGIAEKTLKKMGYSNVHNVGGIQEIIDFVKEYGR